VDGASVSDPRARERLFWRDGRAIGKTSDPRARERLALARREDPRRAAPHFVA
jgi:hypothetical protein